MKGNSFALMEAISDLAIPHTSPEEASIFYEDQNRVKRGGCDAEFESKVSGKLVQ
jgi:hypothetical protein